MGYFPIADNMPCERMSAWKACMPSNEMIAAYGALVAAANDYEIVVDAATAVIR
jgi:hypothetical protein